MNAGLRLEARTRSRGVSSRARAQSGNARKEDDRDDPDTVTSEFPIPRATLLEHLRALPSDWHGAGLLSMAALDFIAAQAPAEGFAHTAETGAGRSTLLLSNVSRDHVVFAKDDGHSIASVRTSPYFHGDSVSIVEGPTQLTLPGSAFEDPLDFVLIDGPHGFPFPDLEYYYLYPQLRPGGILALDDIHIPTIRNLYRFIRADAMFEPITVVQGRTGFLRRTTAPTFDPLGDGWWLQRFNTSHMPMSERLRARLPVRVRSLLKAMSGRG